MEQSKEKVEETMQKIKQQAEENKAFAQSGSPTPYTLRLADKETQAVWWEEAKEELNRLSPAYDFVLSEKIKQTPEQVKVKISEKSKSKYQTFYEYQFYLCGYEAFLRVFKARNHLDSDKAEYQLYNPFTSTVFIRNIATL